MVKSWKIKRNAKSYVVKCENKRNAKNCCEFWET